MNLLLMGGFVVGGYLLLQPSIAGPVKEVAIGQKGLITVIVEQETTTVFRVFVDEGAGVIQALEAFETQFDIPVQVKYSQYGPYVHEVNGLQANDEARWVYYVNEVAPSVGIDLFNIHIGDVLLLKFEQS